MLGGGLGEIRKLPLTANRVPCSRRGRSEGVATSLIALPGSARTSSSWQQGPLIRAESRETADKEVTVDFYQS